MGRRIGTAVSEAAGAVAGYGAILATATVGALAFVDRTAKAVGELHGLAEQTGASASAIASLRTASDTSGVSLDAAARIMERLQATLARPLDPTKGAGAALAAIGLNAEQLRALRPDEQLETIAKALAGFAEGGGRAAVAITLLGKSGAQALPLLNDLAEAGRSQIRLSDEQIDMADRYSKAQARSRSELEQLVQVTALQALPALTAAIQAFRETAGAVVGVDASAKQLGSSTAVATFAENAVTALGHVVDAGDGVARVFAAVGRFVGADAAFVSAAMRGEFAEAKRIGEAFRSDMESLFGEKLFSQRLAERLAASKIPPAAEPAKPVLDFRIPAATTKSAVDSTKAFDALIRSIVEKTSVAQAELDGTEKVSESQRVALQVVTQLAASEGKFTDQQKRAAGALLETYVVTQRAVELRAKQIVAAEELRKAEAASAAAVDRVADARLAENKQLRDAAEEYGKTAAQVEALRIARLSDALATESQALAVGRAHDLSEAEAAGLQRNIDLLSQQIDLRKAAASLADRERTDPLAGAQAGVVDYMRTVTDAGVATRQAVNSAIGGLENDLVSSFASGKPSITSFVSFIISEFYRLAVVRPLVSSIFGGTSTAPVSGGSGFGGWLAGLFASSGSTSGGATFNASSSDLGALFGSVGYGHTGGLAGSLATKGTVNLGVFAGAPRYHDGAIVQGRQRPELKTNEVAAILMGGPKGTREEVLHASDPRHRDNLSPAVLRMIQAIGRGGGSASVPAIELGHATRYHAGGVVGMAPDREPATVFRGSSARRDSLSSASHSSSGGEELTLHVHVTPAPGMSRDTATQQGVQIGSGIQRALRRKGGG